jgi:hypothetical protein
MDKNKIIEVIQNIKDKPNKDLFESRNILYDEFQKTKDLIVDLTKHLDIVQEYYEAVNTEIGNRLIK